MRFTVPANATEYLSVTDRLTLIAAFDAVTRVVAPLAVDPATGRPLGEIVTNARRILLEPLVPDDEQ